MQWPKPVRDDRDEGQAASGVRPLHLGTRLFVLVLPLAAGWFDATGTIDLVRSGRRCVTDCTAGVLLLPFAPTVTPLELSGVGREGHDPSTAAVTLAYVVMLGLLVAWWWYLGGRIAHASRANRVIAHFPRPIVIVVFYVVAVFLTLLAKVPILGLEAWVGVGVSIPVELALWGGLLWGIAALDKARTRGDLSRRS